MPNFTVNLDGRPFDMGHTLDSGQAFRWELRNGWWYGVLPGGVIRARQEGNSLFCATSSERIGPQSVYSYFRLDDDLERIYSRMMKDKQVTTAVQRFYGLRLTRQDVWECLVSFVIATNANIPRIRLMIRTLCERFGEEVSFEGLRYRLFPAPEALASASVESFEDCGLGYRARFVKSVAETVASGAVYLEELRVLDYDRARETLIERVLGKKTLLGIGRKAADCVLLFSCEKDSAFPIDVWIARVLAKYYPGLIGRDYAGQLKSHLAKKARLSAAAYDGISSVMRGYFGEYAGYAQQYLFHGARKE